MSYDFPAIMHPLNKDCFLKLFKYILNEGIGNIYYSTRSAQCPPDGNSYPFARIDFCLNGHKKMSFPQNGENCTITMLPGDLHFSAAYTWKTPIWDELHQMASIVYEQNYIRFTYINYQEKSDFFKTHGANIFYHTATPLPLYAKELLNSISHLIEYNNISKDLRELMPVLLRQTYQVLKEDKAKIISKQQQTFLMVDNYLQENYLRIITRESVAEEFRLSPSYISRLYLLFSDASFNKRLRTLRLEHAAMLLKNTNLSIDEITNLCSYSSPTFLIAAFRNKYGIPPGRYRRKFANKR